MIHDKTYFFRNRVYKNINDSAKIVFNGPGELEIGFPIEYGGRDKTLNPEEMFVAAINGCLMNTFFYFSQKFNLDFISYDSRAKARLEKQSGGFRFTDVNVHATIQIHDAKTVDKIREAGQLADIYCLVSRSVSCPVEYEVDIEIKEA